MKAKRVYIILLFILSSWSWMGCSGQKSTHKQKEKIASNHSVSKHDNDSLKASLHLANIYSQAIGDYLRLTDSIYHLSFDTLYFGKRDFGQADDFPDIRLPEQIGNTQIRLITPEAGVKLQKENPSSYYINMVGWVDKNNTSFIFVTFSNCMAPQFDIQQEYSFDEKNQTYSMKKSSTKDLFFKQKK